MSRQRERGVPSQLELPLFRRERAAASSHHPAQPAAVAPRHESPDVKGAAVPTAPRPGLRVIPGGGCRVEEPLASRDAVVRVLLEAGADLLLRRISPERAGEIERGVERVLGLFDAVDRSPGALPQLERELEALEALMLETRGLRSARRRAP